MQLSPRLQRILVPVAAVVILFGAWRAYGLPGLALGAAGMLMFVLLHFTRLMHILRKASERPIGYVASAVMLNAKLKPRASLVHVMAMTRSLGEARSPADTQPEIFRWTDNGGSYVDCEFHQGKLASWSLTRPEQPVDTADTPQAEGPATFEAAAEAGPAVTAPAAAPAPVSYTHLTLPTKA